MQERFDHGYKRYSSNQNPCRCEICRTAKAAYMRAKRQGATKAETPAEGRRVVEGITHGTAHGYKDNGCRCEPCTAAATVKRNDEIERARRRPAWI